MPVVSNLNSSRPSVRRLSSLAIVSLAVLCLLVVAALVWTATLLQANSAVLIRDSQSVALVTEAEVQLLTHQRLANLAYLTGEPEARVARTAVEGELRGALREAETYTSSAQEADSLRQAASKVEVYLQERKRLDASGLSLAEILRGIRFQADEAVQGLQSLRELNQRGVQLAYSRAQVFGTALKGVAIAAAVSALVLLVAFSWGVRHFLLRPIVNLHDTIERFRSGEPNVRADESAPRELSDIAVAFNDMSAALVRQREEQLSFLAGAAHELRNPLSALSMGVEVLQAERAVATESGRRRLSMLAHQLGYLSRLVDDLLEVTRIEAGKIELRIEEFDLGEAVQSVIRLYAPIATQHSVELEQPGARVIVRADRLRIEQIVGNLISNAVKYSPSGSPIGVRLLSRGDEAVITVSDSGAGLSEEEIKSIFLPFRRASHTGPGAGLGLSVVRRIVTAHGGRIEVDSTPGQGSAFTVRIPLRAGKAVEQDSERRPPQRAVNEPRPDREERRAAKGESRQAGSAPHGPYRLLE
jgi:signal transduction histidine kinase